jgi:hypothetical protein
MTWTRIFTIAIVMLAASTITHAQDTRRLQGYSVVLLLGEGQGTAVPEGLSPSARKALTDIKDFLPYKGYRVLDTQWIAGTERAPLMQLRLRGLGDQEYEFAMGSKMGGQTITPGMPLASSVTLRTPAIDPPTRAATTSRLAMLEDRIRDGKTASAETQREAAQLRQVLAGGQELIGTTVSIGIGETVVVGTSRVQGDKALVMLLTAVPR